MQNMEEKEMKNPAENFVEEINNSNTIQSPTFAAKLLESNEEISRQLSNKDKNTDICLKWVYGVSIILVLAAWETFVIYYSIKQLNPCDKCVHKISDTVFIALLTTATANILALPAIILNYLFPKK